VRLSRFVITYRAVRESEHVLYDVVGDRYVGVDDRTMAALQRWQTSAPRPGEEAEAAGALAELGFLVDDAEADAARLRAAERQAARGMPETAYVTILPTLACNLACGYCIQKDHPATGVMQPDVEAAAMAWIERAAVRSGARRLVVQYIGGEPLLRKDFLLRTAAHLSDAMKAVGIAFGWEITTNGVKLDAGFAHAMSAFGDGLVKITIDGDRETHDAARTYRDGRGSFDEAFGALEQVARECPEVRLLVGGNFSEAKRDSYERLLERMAAAGMGGRLDAVRFKPVIDTGGCGAACGTPAATESLVQLGRSAAARGLTRRESGGVDEVGPCELHWENAWIIDPAGRIYKCFAVAGRPEMAVGSVRDPGPLRPAPLTAARPWDACSDCPFVPVCLGGCIGGAWLTHGRPEVMCDRPRFEIRFREEIVKRYLAEFHPESSPVAVPAAA